MRLLSIGNYFNDGLDRETYKDIVTKIFPSDDIKVISVDQIHSIYKENYETIIVNKGVFDNKFSNDVKVILENFKGLRIGLDLNFLEGKSSNFSSIDLRFLDHIFTRNINQVRELQKIKGAHRAHFLPDLSLLISRPKKIEKMPSAKECGVFLKESNFKNTDIDELAKLIVNLSERYIVKLYCVDNNDYYVSQKVLSKAHELAVRPGHIMLDVKPNDTSALMDIVNKLDFVVTMHYYIHIFSMITNTPLFSIAISDTISLMKHAGLSEFQYITETINYNDMKKVLNYSEKHQALCINKCENFVTKAKFLLDHYQVYRVIHKLSSNNFFDKDILSFINNTGDYLTGAHLLSSYILGYPDSPYVWGIHDKLSKSKNINELEEVLKFSANYLIKEKSSNIPKNTILEYNENKLPIHIDIEQYSSYKDVHRGGWYLAIEKLNKLSSENGIILDMYVDRTFHWSCNYLTYEGKIPYTSPWAGFIHHTQDTSYSNYNTTNLLKLKEFQQSLPTCQGLFTLSEPLSEFIRQGLSQIAPHIRVVTFTHPTVTPLRLFSIPRFENNPNPLLINIGAWMRNPFAIYLVNPRFLNKTILLGKHMENYVPPYNLTILPDSERNNNIDKSPTEFLSRDVPCRPEAGSSSKWLLYYAEYLQSQGITVTSYNNTTVYVADDTNIPLLNLN